MQNDIRLNIKASIALFADDPTLFYLGKGPDNFPYVLTQDFRTLRNRSQVLNVTLNTQKTAVTTIPNHWRDQLILFENTYLYETDRRKHFG